MTKLYQLRREWAKELDAHTKRFHSNLRHAWVSYVMKRNGGYKGFSTIKKEKIAGRALSVYARLMRLDLAVAEAVETEVYWEED